LPSRINCLTSGCPRRSSRPGPRTRRPDPLRRSGPGPQRAQEPTDGRGWSTGATPRLHVTIGFSGRWGRHGTPDSAASPAPNAAEPGRSTILSSAGGPWYPAKNTRLGDTAMPVSIEALGIHQLSVRDRLELIEQIWDSLPEQVEPEEVPAWHLA